MDRVTKKKFIESKIDVSKLPMHNEGRFSNYTEIELGTQKGFVLDDGSQFFFDPDGGWADEDGCYYNEDVEPIGWLINDHFYDIDGTYVPSDEEDLEKLPKHKSGKWTFQESDKKDKGTDEQGCYYDDNGEPLGWMIQKADGKIYLFDMDGSYCDTQKNDLGQFFPQQRRRFQPKKFQPIIQQQNQCTIQIQHNAPASQPAQTRAPKPQMQGSQQINYKFQLTNSTVSESEMDLKLLQAYLSGRDVDKVLTMTMPMFKQLTLTIKASQEIQGFRSLSGEFEYFPGKKAKPLI